VTPFLLDRMRELTGGASVRANLALLRNNARVAAALAGALARPPVSTSI
jgi:pseudouridine-5'-phosphate glycosidase